LFIDTQRDRRSDGERDRGCFYFIKASESGQPFGEAPAGEINWDLLTEETEAIIELISKLGYPVVVYSVSGQPAWEGKTDGVSGVDG
jgi:hypothetical protein